MIEADTVEVRAPHAHDLGLDPGPDHDHAVVDQEPHLRVNTHAQGLNQNHILVHQVTIVRCDILNRSQGLDRGQNPP